MIPLLVLLALRMAPARVALLMLPFTLIHDIDYWIGTHRATLHNIFVVLPALFLWYKWRNEPPQRATYAGVSAYYLASHVFLDLFAGGVVLLYPLWNMNIYLNCRVLVETATDTIIPTCTTELGRGAPTVVDVYTWISPFEISIVVWSLGMLGGLYALRWYRERDT